MKKPAWRARPSLISLLREYRSRRDQAHPVMYRAQPRGVAGIRLVAPLSKEPRLNVVFPHFFAEDSFAGIKTALELVRALSRHYRAIRFISLWPLERRDRFDPAACLDERERERVEVVSVAGGEPLSCHEHEVFFCTWWKTVMLWEAYAASLQAAGFRKNQFYYFIQDFEPGFYPFGCEYAMAHKTYAWPDHTHAIVNSRELHDFLKARSCAFSKEYTVRPSLDRDIFDYLKARSYRLPEKAGGTIRILVYGRPNLRNCFESIVEGLYRFFAGLPSSERERYTVVQAGSALRSIELCPGLVMRSVGKLSMAQYIEELERSHIGISFMESPHPSYPPLEMATFGLYTITNTFCNKDLSRHHPLIHSISHPLPDELATALRQAVACVSKAGIGAREAVLPDTLCPLSWSENLEAIGIAPIASNNV